jgi:hypothetical protein
MNGSAVNAYLPPSARRGFRIAGLIAAVICVLAIAAGVFVVSYTGVRDLVLSTGVAAHYARFYPWLFDAVVVVAAVAALSLRGALRAYAWLAILVLLGAVAAADAVHAMSISLPKRPTEATVAAAPWAVLLIGFTLLYAMARQGLLPTRRSAAAANSTSNGKPENGAAVTQVSLSALLADKPATRPERAQAALTARPATTAPATTAAAKPEPPAKAAPAPKTEPVAAKTEQSTPHTEPVTGKGEPASTTPASTQPASTEPVTPKTEPAASRTEPLTTKAEPVNSELPGAEPITAKTEQSAPHTEPVAPSTPAEPITRSAEPAGTEPPSAEPATAKTEQSAPHTEPVTPTTPAEPVTRSAEPYPVAYPPPSTDAAPYPARPQQFTMRQQPMVSRPVTEPERPVRQSADRDDPSDADAEPVEPAAHFNRLRSGPTPPADDDEDQA